MTKTITLADALEPFLDAARGIPAAWADQRPIMCVNRDRVHPGTTRIITVEDFRKLSVAAEELANLKEQMAAAMYGHAMRQFRKANVLPGDDPDGNIFNSDWEKADTGSKGMYRELAGAAMNLVPQPIRHRGAAVMRRSSSGWRLNILHADCDASYSTQHFETLLEVQRYTTENGLLLLSAPGLPQAEVGSS